MGDPLKQIIDLRCFLTGESHSLASDLVHSGLRSLPTGTTSAALFRQIASGQRAVGSTGALRSVLLPDATSRFQQRLETSLLLRVRECAPPASHKPYNGHKVFRMVSPRREGLVIDVAEETVERFLRALLPVPESNGDYLGIPGVRFSTRDDDLQMHLLDSSGRLTDACVILQGIGKRRWRRIWSQIGRIEYEETVSIGRCLDPILIHTPILDQIEVLDWDHPPEPNVALGSAILRRYGLFKDAFAIDVWQSGRAIIALEIDLGRPAEEVLQYLRTPYLGLDPDRYSINVKNRVIIDRAADLDKFEGGSPHTIQQPALQIRTLRSHDDWERDSLADVAMIDHQRSSAGAAGVRLGGSPDA